MQFIVKTIGSILNFISSFAPSFASGKALKLFATPRKGRYTDAELPILQSAYVDELEYNGMAVFSYRWLGEGDTILLAHGWESNAARWHYLLKSLKDNNFNIIAIDAPAHGNSGSNEFNAILYSEFINIVAQKYQPKIVIGHSVGGMATIFFQNKYQLKSLKKIVTLGSPAHFEGVFKRYAQMMQYNTKIVEGMNDLVLERFGNLPSHYSTAKFSESIAIEGLIIHDKFDTIIPYSDGELIHKHFKNSKLVTTEKLGHGLKGEFATQSILEFINA